VSDRQQNTGVLARRILLTAGAALVLLIVLYLLKPAAHVVLIVFGGILLAVFLDALASALASRTRLSRGASLGVVIVVLLGLLTAFCWLAGPRVATQVGNLAERIPTSIESIKASLSRYEWGRRILSNAPEPQEVLPLTSDVLRRIGVVFSTALGAVIEGLIVLFVGIYLAVNPDLYIDNAVKLLPVARRKRAREVFAALGRALRWWLVGRVASMIVVGILTAIGLAIAGVPLALTLALIAALLAFIPFIGPVLGAIPAILVALAEKPVMAWYVIIVFTVVQLLENYLITPLIQQRAVSIAPALLITVQILMAVLFGAVGVFLATPLAVTVIVIIQMLYIEDVLGDKVKVLGER
jgi:predicted PurR-regulated permease PerM